MAIPVPSPDIVQLYEDVYAVFIYGTKTLESFPVDYQERLKVAYQFMPTYYESSFPRPAPRTRDTLDLI